MGISDIFNKEFYDQYLTLNVNITVQLMLVTLGMTALLTLFLVAVYRITYRGAIFSYSFAVSMALSAMVTSLIILPISSNIALSIGTGGVLSMVRYRTAVKDPKDIAFMFWAIGIGLTCGIGFYLVAAAGSAFIGVIMIVISLAANIKGSPEPCIAVVRLAPDANINRVRSILKGNVKSMVVTDDYIELTAELRSIPNKGTLESLKKEARVINMSFVKYNGDYAI